MSAPNEPFTEEHVAVDVNNKQATTEGTEPQPPFKLYGSNETMTLRWSGLTFEVETGDTTKTILNGCSGLLRPGELTAIMGPSGAGKSTLMNVLAGRAPYGKASGSISMNGHAVDPVKFRKSLAYVMQEDALFATQTPRETLTFTAALKLPHLSSEERHELVEAVIDALGLRSCADTMIGSVMVAGLSGGEKKRTAIAVELISSPRLIFLDEPTTGLDSYSAFVLLKNLRSLALTGATIVCTIHQPSSEVFDMFHNVMLLRSGSVVYSGPVESLVPHFSDSGYPCKPNYNPADFAMHLLQTLDDSEIEKLVLCATPMKEGGSIDGISEVREVNTHVHSAGFAVQLCYLLRREAQHFIRDKDTLGARYGMCVVLSFLIGLVFWGQGGSWGTTEDEIFDKINNHWGALTFVAINMMFLSAQPLLLVFPLERPVFMREYTSGTYGTSAYLISKTLLEIPTAFLQSVLTLVICYWMIGLNGNFILIVLSMLLLAVVSGSIAVILGSATTRAETAINIMPAIYVPQILLSGFFISSSSIPVWMRWIQWVCPLKYGLSLATLAEFSNSAVPDHREPQAASLINRSNINRDHWWIYTLIMLGLFFGFRIIAGFLLAKRAKTFA